ncbi:MAG: ShlB/FhaC/HecB family hemolysin secretion/activation protein [Alphaproteobacteria bacterium]|nr:ShlB/FhaC/HecB family hemolysin secretion/activation protein [Alphaproteobacteria bacterium]
MWLQRHDLEATCPARRRPRGTRRPSPVALAAAALVVGALAVGGAALAQPAPAAITAPPTERGTRPLAPPLPGLVLPQARSGETPAGAETVRFTPRAITVQGVTVYPRAEIEAMTRPLIGREVPASEIFALAQAIERKYREDGYFLTLAIVPQQRITNGAVQIRIVEGYIDNVRVEGDVGPVQELIERFAARISLSRPTNIRDVERYLLLADDIPGISVRAVMRQGGSTGGSELVLQAARKEFDVLAQLDNRGSNFIGPQQFYLTVGANSFTALGERLEALYFTTFDREQNFGQVAASGHVGSDGVRLRAYAGYGRTRPGAALGPTGYRGEVKVAGASASYPVIRSRRANLNVSGGLDMYSSTVDLAGGGASSFTRQSETEVRAARLTIEGNLRDSFNGVTFGQVRVSRGLDMLEATGPGDRLLSRPNIVTDFTKVSGDISRLQALWASESWTFNLLATFAGQWTNDVMYPSEKFFFGGERYGRGFYSGQVTGDRAWATTLELQANTYLALSRDEGGRPWGFPAQFYVFFDAGNAYNIAPGDVRSTRLRSYGVGGRFDLNEWLAMELEGVQRETQRVDGANARPISGPAFFWRISARF